MKIGIAAIFKNECKFIIEWIAYHRAIGIDYFIIADNESSDGSSQLLTDLQRLGIIQKIAFPTPPDQRPQLLAYQHMLSICPNDINLLAFIDADEFILPLDGADTIRPFFEDIFSDKSINALALNWATYGSSGQIFVEDDLVIRRFSKMAARDFSVNNHYKSIVRPEYVMSFENPHHAVLRSGRYVDSSGNDIKYHLTHGHGLSEKVIWERARINHYAVKSLEEFLVGKSRNGSASKEFRIKHAAYFRRHDKNDEVSEIPQVIQQKVTLEIEVIQDKINSLPPKSRSDVIFGFKSKIDDFFEKLKILFLKN